MSHSQICHSSSNLHIRDSHTHHELKLSSYILIIFFRQKNWFVLKVICNIMLQECFPWFPRSDGGPGNKSLHGHLWNRLLAGRRNRHQVQCTPSGRNVNYLWNCLLAGRRDRHQVQRTPSGRNVNYLWNRILAGC